MTITLYKEAFTDVSRVNKLDPASTKLRLCKLLEEMGELAQLVNKKLGRKVVKETEEELYAHILEELADVTQCLYSWYDSLNSSTEKDMENILEFSNIPLKSTEDLADLLIEMFKGTMLSDAENPTRRDVSKILVSIILIARVFDLSFDDINKEVLKKNKKWQKIVEARVKEDKQGLWPFS
jgi:NTP pyrophosphatase (non-canonical NTP hydrolase)